MRVTVYQIDLDRDVNNVAFRDYEFTQKHQRVPGVESVIYDKAYSGEIPARTLEDVYYVFNCKHPADYYCRSLTTSDVLEISGCPTVPDGFYFCDSIGFKKVDFDPTKTQVFERYNQRLLEAASKVDPKTGLIHMEARLGISLEVSPEEFMKLHGYNSDARHLLVKLIQSDRCVMGGNTYFPQDWNEEILHEDLEFDLPEAPLSVPEKKPSLADQIQSSEARSASQLGKQGKDKDNDIVR